MAGGFDANFVDPSCWIISIGVPFFNGIFVGFEKSGACFVGFSAVFAEFFHDSDQASFGCFPGSALFLVPFISVLNSNVLNYLLLIIDYNENL